MITLSPSSAICSRERSIEIAAWTKRKTRAKNAFASLPPPSPLCSSQSPYVLSAAKPPETCLSKALATPARCRRRPSPPKPPLSNHGTLVRRDRPHFPRLVAMDLDYTLWHLCEYPAPSSQTVTDPPLRSPDPRHSPTQAARRRYNPDPRQARSPPLFLPRRACHPARATPRQDPRRSRFEDFGSESVSPLFLVQ